MADDLPAKQRKYTPRSYDKLVGVDPQIILDRVAKGELLREIAEDYGCSRSAVSMFIGREVPKEEWMAIREESIAARIENSTQQIEQATDQLSLARAREAARLWMWRAEREFGHIYQAKPSTAVQINGQEGMSVQIVSYAAPDSTPQLTQAIDSTEDDGTDSTD
jgi:hypothetical protein